MSARISRPCKRLEEVRYFRYILETSAGIAIMLSLATKGGHGEYHPPCCVVRLLPQTQEDNLSGHSEGVAYKCCALNSVELLA